MTEWNEAREMARMALTVLMRWAVKIGLLMCVWVIFSAPMEVLTDTDPETASCADVALVARYTWNNDDNPFRPEMLAIAPGWVVSRTADRLVCRGIAEMGNCHSWEVEYGVTPSRIFVVPGDTIETECGSAPKVVEWGVGAGG